MRFLVLILLLSGSLAQAAPVTVTFESVDISGYPRTISDSGFEFYSSAGFLSSDGTPAEPSANGQAAFYCPGCTATMTVVGGGVFDLQSFSTANLLGAPQPFSVTGTYAGGGTIATNVQVAQPWGVITLGAGWTNLVSVEFGAAIGDAVGLDNIVANVIPLPAAAWLFISALAGLGMMRRG